MFTKFLTICDPKGSDAGVEEAPTQDPEFMACDNTDIASDEVNGLILAITKTGLTVSFAARNKHRRQRVHRNTIPVKPVDPHGGC